MEAQLKKGFLEYVVLASIKKEKSYGYKIIQSVSPIIEISESTLYPILKRLEKEGCIIAESVEHNGRLRKYFSITIIGKEKLISFSDEIEIIQKIYNFIKGACNE